ncbi:hypothetical protein AB205_0182090 [Aquarana catesbeiana]|uniref:RanBD1 domain-containing protein n=1 Tax=Aquarana catesbeiana TaxID=8400 RepID=A0A2G9RQF9_AQUCT|nr:hypothetical protein AB205_0182090 [Aquarana catesbeiana]
MRNQQTSIIRENNVFFPEIEPLSARSFQTQSHKSAMCITASSRGPVHSTVHRAASECASHDRRGDNSLLTQPAFAQDKKERSFKRHAGDLVLKSEHGLCVYEEKRFRSSSFTFRPSSSSSEHGPSEKRVRSSSFSLLTTFPPNQPALKNNVFMPSTLLQERTQRNNKDSEEMLHTWTVIKPATLQPPQITLSSDIKSSQTRTEEKILEEKRKALVNNAGQPKSAHGSTCILGMETRMQPFDQMPPKYTTDFIFGENMERRVMSPKRPTPSQTRVPLCRRESTSSRLSYNRNWPYQKHRLHTSLLESAAAYTSRPRMKYELDQVKVITGEESERNVLQISCKLFVFNKENQVWTERGRGYLRLNDLAVNDDGPFRSRIGAGNSSRVSTLSSSPEIPDMASQGESLGPIGGATASHISAPVYLTENTFSSTLQGLEGRLATLIASAVQKDRKRVRSPSPTSDPLPREQWAQDEVLPSGDQEERQTDYSSAEETTPRNLRNCWYNLTEMVRTSFKLPLAESADSSVSSVGSLKPSQPFHVFPVHTLLEKLIYTEWDHQDKHFSPPKRFTALYPIEEKFSKRWKASVKDAARLHAAIHHRLIAMSSFRAKQESMAINEDENRSHSQLLHSDSEDEEDDERKLCSSKMSDHLQLIRQRPVLHS